VEIEVIFLGTGGSAPSAARAPAATVLRREGEMLLVDCGEGTQRQLLRSTLGLTELDAILFTHYHADHVLGLPGLLKTYDLQGRQHALQLIGPSGLRELMRLFSPFLGRLGYPIELLEAGDGDVVERSGYRLLARSVRHRGPSIAWALVEDGRPGVFDASLADELGVPHGPERGALLRGAPVTLDDGRSITPEQLVGPARRGRSVVLTGDTVPCNSVVDLAAGADLLVHEATFTADDAERAKETQHSTAGGAALVALEANVRMLALTHVGLRSSPREIEAQARAVFTDAVVPRDFDIIVIPLPERGAPRLEPRAARRGRRRRFPTTFRGRSCRECRRDGRSCRRPGRGG
jgi:ribonuclease Z